MISPKQKSSEMEAALTHRQLNTAYGGFHEHINNVRSLKYIAQYGLWEIYVVGADGWVIPLRLNPVTIVSMAGRQI